MTPNPPLQLIQQKWSLIQELETALYAIESGLAILQKNRASQPEPRHFTFLLLLTTGLERLMKVVLCLDTFEKTGAFPSTARLKKGIGHDLIKLRSKIAQDCFSTDYRKHPAGTVDYAFLTAAPLVDQLFLVLNDFANDDRYIFMNGISDPTSGNEWPKLRWERLERATMTDERYFRLIRDGNLQAIKEHATPRLVACIEQIVRTFARLFTLGDLGDEARRNSSIVYNFLMLTDQQLGRKQYSV